MSFISSTGVDPKDMAWNSGYTEGEAKFAYIKQSYNGVPFANAVANVAFYGDKVVSYGSSFVDPKTAKIAPSTASVTWKSALPVIESALDGKHNGLEPTLEYLVKPDGSVALTHVLQIRNEETNAWYEAFIDGHSGELISVTDFVAHDSYTVLPITKQTFPEGLETLRDPQDLQSSPLGWHDTGSGNSTTTSGNNVLSFKSTLSSPATQSSAGLNFNQVYTDTQDPTTASNIDAAKTNAFYIINSMHDFAYRYGFTEKAFNFQQSNFGKGGKERDRVLMSVQDASGVNNANFATPPDGQSGQCRMFIWTLTNPRRDGTMENDIVIHEMTHGITNRMTGGGTGRCLQTTESGGMGEGWSDAVADWMAQTSETTNDFVVGQYVSNRAQGLRSFPYSTSPTTNPLLYSSLQTLTEVHDIGEVWANMLHQVSAALVAAHGFSNKKLTDANGKEGNIVFMRVMMDALAIQPCNPTFVEARDAILQADQNRYNGANTCIIAKAFASRGLGLKATANFVDDATLPTGC
jgi:extracellular elastinolytic metalloproteinase